MQHLVISVHQPCIKSILYWSKSKFSEIFVMNISAIEEDEELLLEFQVFDGRDLMNVISYTVMSLSKQKYCKNAKTILLILVGMMSNTWVLIIAGRQASRPDVR